MLVLAHLVRLHINDRVQQLQVQVDFQIFHQLLQLPIAPQRQLKLRIFSELLLALETEVFLTQMLSL